jgi:hypothetical protein
VKALISTPSTAKKKKKKKKRERDRGREREAEKAIRNQNAIPGCFSMSYRSSLETASTELLGETDMGPLGFGKRISI